MVSESQLFTNEYPFSGHYYNHNGLRQHYLDEGQGDPVVMVHGNPSWSFYYRRLALELSRDHRVIVPDHIGCGLSDKPADSDYEYTLEQRVQDLDSLINALDLDQKITLVVHDWGGMIGMAWAVRNPGRIGRIVLLNTAAFPLPEAKPLPLALKICRNTQLGVLLVQGFNLFASAAAWVGCKRNPMSAEMRKLFCSPYNSWQNRVATLRFVQDIPLKPGDPGYDLVAETANGLTQFAHLPICMFWGELDFVFDDHFLQHWLKVYPQMETHLFPDCGHYILEDAADEVVPGIRSFLDQHPLSV